MTVVVRRIKNCFGYLIKGASGIKRVNGLESKKSMSVSWNFCPQKFIMCGPKGFYLSEKCVMAELILSGRRYVILQLRRTDLLTFYKSKETFNARVFYMQRLVWLSSSLLTLPWIEPQILLKCCLIHITIIVLRHFLYLVHLCLFLHVDLYMSYLCGIFFITVHVFILNIIIWLHLSK